MVFGEGNSEHLEIQSEDNVFQRFAAIRRTRAKRNKHSQFLVEGVKCLNAAAECGWSFEAVAYANNRDLSHWAIDFLKFPSVKRTIGMPDSLLEKLSDKEEGSELLAIVNMPSDDLERLPTPKDALYVAMDRPASPGNLGSSIRSSSCFGVDGMVITGHSTDLYHPHAVRGSMGALFSLPVIRGQSHQTVLKIKHRVSHQGIKLRIVGTSSHADKSLYETDLTGPILFAFGNETVGLSSEYQKICDEFVSIPIGGVVSSLNVSCALSVTIAEAKRQRQHSGPFK